MEHPSAPSVASLVARLINQHDPALLIQHVGSSTVPGCAGKGIIDLIGRAGSMRPIRVGAMTYAGRPYRLHVHVIAREDGEAAELRAFRDRLRADPGLAGRYVACKRAIIAAGTTDSTDDAIAKGSFVRRVLASMRLPATGAAPGSWKTSFLPVAKYRAEGPSPPSPP